MLTESGRLLQLARLRSLPASGVSEVLNSSRPPRGLSYRCFAGAARHRKNEVKGERVPDFSLNFHFIVSFALDSKPPKSKIGLGFRLVR
jgi:hypothetical protein